MDKERKEKEREGNKKEREGEKKERIKGGGKRKK
jgi:hypothetical protein